MTTLCGRYANDVSYTNLLEYVTCDRCMAAVGLKVVAKDTTTTEERG